MNLALPMTLATGTVPDIGSPVHSRPFSVSAGMLTPVGARVCRVCAVIAHHPQPPLRDGDR